MSFPETVACQALVSCGRRCCICHKFCGTKIELHHIKQKAYGGEDTVENCIPLCFDCHADMGNGDPKHPKGKRYSEKELKMHRDNWYQKVTTSNLISENIPICDEDRALFEKICAMFNPEVELWLSQKSLAGMHPLEVFSPLGKYIDTISGNPFEEFINIDLEELRGNLLGALRAFLHFKAIHTSYESKGEKGFYVTHLWLAERDLIPYPDQQGLIKFEEEANKLDDLATDLWNKYCEFVREGRRILAIK